MKTYGRYVIAALAVGLGVFLFYLSASAWGNFISAKDKIMLCLEQPLSIREAREKEQEIKEEWIQNSQQESQDDHMPEFCIWGQKDEVMLTNENLSRSIQANGILLCGNPELLFGDCRVPDGKDSRGCLLDEEAAWELFGSIDVMGKEISYEGQSYVIRKVIPGKEKIFALQVSSLIENGVLNRITMQRPQGRSVRDLELMWNIHGLSVAVLDLELLRGIGGFCVLLLPTTSCLCFLCYLFCRFRKEEQLVWKASMVAMGLVVAACFLLLIKNQVNIPDDYIPTRWSDFSFWQELWKEKQETVRLLLKMPKTVQDYGWMDMFGRTLAFGLLAENLVGGYSIFKCNLALKEKI